MLQYATQGISFDGPLTKISPMLASGQFRPKDHAPKSMGCVVQSVSCGSSHSVALLAAVVVAIAQPYPGQGQGSDSASSFK
eukprot:1157186-Pelagomonas_calceolata.AAC.7